MRRPRPWLSVALVLAVAVAAGVGAGCEKERAATPAAGEPAGDVREATGAVSAERDGQARPLAVGDVVAREDVVVTGDDGDVVIELRHNGVRWRLGPGQRKQVDASAAWSAPRPTGDVAAGDRTTAAGRHAEREAADTAASAQVVAGAGQEAAAGAEVARDEETAARGEARATAEVAEGDRVPTGEDDPAPKSGRPKRRTSGSSSGDKSSGDRDGDDRGGGGGGDDRGGGGGYDTLDRASGGGCDEVACVLDPGQPCCAKPAKTKRKGGGGPSGDANLPDAPSAADVKATMSKLRSRLKACSAEHGDTGTRRVRVEVAPSGAVASVTVDGNPDATASCIAGVIRGARFPSSQKGLTFTYPVTP